MSRFCLRAGLQTKAGAAVVQRPAGQHDGPRPRQPAGDDGQRGPGVRALPAVGHRHLPHHPGGGPPSQAVAQPRSRSTLLEPRKRIAAHQVPTKTRFYMKKGN